MNTLGGSDTAHPGAAVLPARAAGTSPHPASNLAPGSNAGGFFGRKQKRRAKKWDAATIAQIGEFVAAKWSQAQIAKALGISGTGFRLRAERLGIPFVRNVMAEAQARGAVVLREHYALHADIGALLALYVEAVGRPVRRQIMGEHANRLGLTRLNPIHAVTAGRLATLARKRVAKAAEFQALLDGGMGVPAAKRAMRLCDKTVARMRAEGLLVVPLRVAAAKVAPVPKSPRVVAAKPVKTSRIPASYVRAEKPAAPPRTYQTVAGWLAAGNAVTRCPAAMATHTQATTSAEDRAALAAHHEAQRAALARQGNLWKAARRASYAKNVGTNR